MMTDVINKEILGLSQANFQSAQQSKINFW